MLLYLLFWTILGFIFHFYIIFGTNLLTGGPAQNCYFFCLFQCFEETEYQMESKWNKTFRNVIFSPNLIQETWTPMPRHQRGGHEGGGRPPRARPLPRGPLVAPPAYFFLLYIHTYPQTIRTGAKKPNSTAATFCIHEIPSWGLFRSSARRRPSSRRASTSS